MDIKFSNKQKKIVESFQGAMTVIASAGSGKTRVLAGRIHYLLTKVPGSHRVLALTFTNKAADEMKNRLSSIPNFNEKGFIGTIHSFCLNILREKGNVIGYSKMPHLFEKESDRREVLSEVFKRNEILSNFYLQKDEADRKKMLTNALEHISYRKRNLQLVVKGEEEEKLNILYDDYNRFLLEQNAIDYDDIILLAYRIFVERPRIAELYRNLYKYICVDEAQDLNYAQYEFIKIICGTTHNNVLMVGDNKQAIFGFNGSDSKYFTKLFVKDFTAELIQLDENYRSSKAVISVANLIYPKSISESNVIYDGKTDYYTALNENDEADYIIKQIKYYLTNISSEEKTQIEGEINLNKICIIARNKYIFNTLKNKLEVNKIQCFFKRSSDTKLFESDEMKIFELGLRVILNPMDTLHLRQILSILEIKTDSINLAFIKECLTKNNNPIYTGILSAWEIVEKNNHNFREPIEAIQSFINKTNTESEENFLQFIYEEIEQAKSYWIKYCGSVAPNTISVQNFLSNIALGMVNIENQKETGVTLATVHSVKGLEYDIIFVMGLNEGSFPDYRAVRTGGKYMEEEKNLTYVALTRSKRFLHLSYPKEKIMPWDKENPYSQKVSRFFEKQFTL